MPAQAEVYSCTPGGTILAGRLSSVIDNAKYKTNAQQLFYDAPLNPVNPLYQATNGTVQSARASVAAPKFGKVWYTIGPNEYHVEASTQWRWINRYGDWKDANGTSQGTSPAATFSAMAVSGASAAYTYTVDFTTAAQQCYALDTWNAWVVRCSVNRVWSSRHGTNPPVLTVTYTDGQIKVLKCLASVRLPNGTAYTFVGKPEIWTWGSNAVLEFERPTKPILSASLSFTVLTHPSVGQATFNFFLCDPPMNPEGPTGGLSVDYPLDVGITAHPDVWFAQSYPDGSALTDYVIEPNVSHNYGYLNEWSPHLFNDDPNYGYFGPVDETRLPYAWHGSPVAGSGKFLQGATGFIPLTLVDSSYTGEGFEPVAPGLGALKVTIQGAHAADGAVVSGGKLTGTELWAYLDESRSGLQRTLFVRFMYRLGTYPLETIDQTKMYRLGSPSATAEYETPGGKTGIGPEHWTPFGGNNRTGGGNKGHFARCVYESFADVDLGSIAFGLHGVDMWFGHAPSGTSGDQVWSGQQGPHGVRLKRGVWYDIEVEMTLNTWNTLWDTAPTHDGEYRMWIDGVKCIDFTNFSFRQGPLNYTNPADTSAAVDRGYTPLGGQSAPPFREIGHKGIGLQDYNGGITPCEHDQTVFYANIVSSYSRIGPMVTEAPPPPLPDWAPVAGEIKTISYAGGTHPDGPLGGAVMGEISPSNMPWSPTGTNSPWSDGGYSMSSIHAYAGAVFNTDTREICNIGAGHVAICIPTIWKYGLPDLKWSWGNAPVPSDGYQAALVAAAGGTGTYAFFSAVYTLEQDSPTDWQFSMDWCDWSGDYSGWPVGFDKPGEIFPETGHSYKTNCFVPASIYGNTKGAFIKFGGATGKSTGIAGYGCHIFDFDTNKWERAANKPVAAGGYPIVDLVSGLILRNYSTSGAASYTMNQWQLFDPTTKLNGATRTSTGSPYQWGSGGSTTVALHPPSRLMFIATTCDASGVTSSGSPTKQRMYGANFDTALAGNFSWTAMNMTNASGIWPAVSGTTSWWHQTTWEYCPKDGNYYCINGRDAETRVWRLSPPVGAVTYNDFLSGEWKVTIVQMTSGAFYCRGGLGTGTSCNVYNRVKWDSVSESFMWFSDSYFGPVQAFNPVGVAGT